MGNNAVFLEALTLQLARELRFDGAERHFIEVLMEGEGAPRIREAVQWMPEYVEELVASGRWRPRDLKEWKWLAVIALWDELQARMPRSLELGMALENGPTRYIGAGLLFTPDQPLFDVLAEGFRNDDPNNRAYSALAVSANGHEDYIGALRAMMDDPHPWPRVNAIASLVRIDDVQGIQEARDLFSRPPSARRSEAVSYLFEVLDRAAPHPNVLRFVTEMQGTLRGQDRAAVDAILVIHGAQTDTSKIRAVLMELDPFAPELHRGVRALARTRKPEDAAALEALFHRPNSQTVTLDLAAGLAKAGSDEVEPLLRNAAFRLPWSQALLAAGAARACYGDELLVRWIENAPATTPIESCRRIGLALGEFGGPEAVALLKKHGAAAGAGELPASRSRAVFRSALQGAELGVLSRVSSR
ncbi:HEAT repeat domain-containing protein [Planctomycetes bacterium Poly30]